MDYYECNTCGALVCDDGKARHEKFHARVDEALRTAGQLMRDRNQREQALRQAGY